MLIKWAVIPSAAVYIIWWSKRECLELQSKYLEYLNRDAKYRGWYCHRLVRGRGPHTFTEPVSCECVTHCGLYSELVNWSRFSVLKTLPSTKLPNTFREIVWLQSGYRVQKSFLFFQLSFEFLEHAPNVCLSKC